jgi:uncharacterized protein YdbL (DUF1318 family)
MTRIRTAPSPAAIAKVAIGALALGLGLLLASPVFAQVDNVVAGARASGQVGEQADGYLGFPPGVNVSADVRARVDQLNIRRRAAYTQRAAQRNVSVNEMAAAVACEIFSGRVAVGERYRSEDGSWRQRTAAQAVVMPSFCPD